MKFPIVLTLLITITAHTHANLIESTCKNTPNPRLCTTTLRSSRGSATADVAGLGLILVGAVKSKSREALYAVYKLGKIRDSKLSEALQQCRDAYKAVLDGDVPEAEQSLRGDPKFAENGMADAAVEADTCESAFGGKTSPLSGVNKAVRDLAVVARAVIRNLL